VMLAYPGSGMRRSAAKRESKVVEWSRRAAKRASAAAPYAPQAE